MSDLTIIIPTYEMPDKVRRAVASVRRQGLGADIVVVDDCSSTTLDIEPGADLAIIRHDQNRGAGAARNTGITHVGTPWVGFLDADDELLEGTLATRFDFARGVTGDRPTIIGCGWIEDDEAIVRLPHRGDTAEAFASGCWYCPGSTLLARREVFAERPLHEPLRRLEDFDWGIRFGADGGRLVVQNVAGVRIVRTVATGSAQVEAAAEMISMRAAALFADAPDRLCRVRAYLDYEKAAFAWAEGRRAQGLRYLAASWLRVPRLRKHLSPGWTWQRRTV
ncbi:glycosyltransferase [Rhizobiaceae bacterium]|nr:glycosyltransferase [Rhizobiaceae bacterium]